MQHAERSRSHDLLTLFRVDATVAGGKDSPGTPDRPSTSILFKTPSVTIGTVTHRGARDRGRNEPASPTVMTTPHPHRL
jgi:hypothetical protein